MLLFYLLVLLALFRTASSCLPGQLGYGFYPPPPYRAPAPAPYFNPAAAAPVPPVYPGVVNPAVNPYGPMAAPILPRLGPFRSEAQQTAAAEPFQRAVQIGASNDEVDKVEALNCSTFDPANSCRWLNEPEDELDWTTLKSAPNADVHINNLGVHALPDIFAAALVSGGRRGWDGGKLVSNPLPCMGTEVKLTATAWKTRNVATSDQPKLQLCSRNVNNGNMKFPPTNCNEFEIRNGVPISQAVPPPDDQNAPAQIILYGNNFVAPEGSAIFLQDIVVEGSLPCRSVPSHPLLISEGLAKKFENEMATKNLEKLENVGPLKAVEPADELEPIDAAPRSPFFDDNGGKEPKSFINSVIAKPSAVRDTSAAINSISGIPTLFESCLALSCNPSDLSCKFWRSAGNNRWEIGTAGRVANPLTGIHLPPGTSQKFLVAPFLDKHINSYTLVSEALTVPPIEDVFFCFYEYYATQGLSLSVCTDKLDCFYKKNTLGFGSVLEDSKKWNIRCAKLPAGTYELRVIAENEGENKGEVGFLPIRLARDPNGQQFIC